MVVIPCREHYKDTYLITAASHVFVLLSSEHYYNGREANKFVKKNDVQSQLDTRQLRAVRRWRDIYQTKIFLKCGASHPTMA